MALALLDMQVLFAPGIRCAACLQNENGKDIPQDGEEMKDANEVMAAVEAAFKS